MTINSALATGIGVVSLCLLASTATAKTEPFDFTMYGIQVKSGDDSKTPNGVRRIVNGETSSEWCYGEDLPDASPRALSYVGYCATFYDDGSLLWTSITWNAGDNQSGRWIVLGGSGRYAGATGGGTSANVSTRADGNAWTGRGSGTITTP